MKRYDLVIFKSEHGTGGAVEEREAGEFVKFTDMLEYTLDVCNESISNAKRANVNFEIATGFRDLNIVIMKESLHFSPIGDPCELKVLGTRYFTHNKVLYRTGTVTLNGHNLVEDVLNDLEDMMDDKTIVQPVKFTVWEIPNV
jgi:hypothetical protein